MASGLVQTVLLDEDSAATLSGCNRYRYTLYRRLNRPLVGGVSTIIFAMLNPSTADAALNDPTIRRCLKFARKWGNDELHVVNLFAWRATSPVELFRDDIDPVGPENDRHIARLLAGHPQAPVVCAWGNLAGFQVARGRDFMAVHGDLRRTVCMGVTKQGYPRHPLYVHGNTGLIDYIGRGE